MRKLLSGVLALTINFVTAQIFITEIADPNNESGARFVELFNIGTSDVDLGAGWALQRWTNASTDPQAAVNLTGTIPAGGFYIICSNGSVFESTFGFSADQNIGTGGPADSNGDDNIALLDATNTIVDMFGVSGEDGSGTEHEFEDGRAERISTITSGNPTWDVAEWNIDNDSGGGDGTQDAPDDFDPNVWFDYTDPDTPLENTITINLYDSYGDGWNGGILTVAGTDYTIDAGDVANFTADLADGNYEWSYAPGGWASENSWNCFDGSNNLLFSGEGADGAQGGVFTLPFQTTIAIYDVQYVSDPETDDASPMVGQTVMVQGIVTGIRYNGIYVQDAEAGWSGLWVYMGTDMVPATMARGDLVSATGDIIEYNNLTEMENATVVELGEGYSVAPIWVDSTAGANHEMWENVLINVEGGTEDDEADNYGQWNLDDGSGPIQIEDHFLDWDPNSTYWYDMVGIGGHSSYDDPLHEMAPRDSADVMEYPPCELPNDVMIACDGGSWQSEVSWELLDDMGDTVAVGGAPYYVDFCLDDGVYTIYMHDAYGDGWNGNVWLVYDYDADSVLFATTIEAGAEAEATFVLGETADVFGCMDPAAVNYNADATIDDGSCYFAGDSCAIALTAVAGDAGNQADGDIEWFTFTASMDGFMTITTCYAGQMEDSHLQIWTACPDDGGTMIANNDDAFCADITGGNNYASHIQDVPIVAGTTYIISSLDTWSPGPFVWYLYESPPPSAPQNLTAEAGLEMVSLMWEPLPPDSRSGGSQAVVNGDMNSSIQDNYEASLAKKDAINANRPEMRTLDHEKLARQAAEPRRIPQRYRQVLNRDSRDATIWVDFYDSYGDGYAGNGWITNEDTGEEVAYFPGSAGWSEISYGPFDLVDGLYSMNVEDASWASETTWEVVDTTSGEVLAAGAVPTVTYFTIGEGTTPQADLSFTDLWYDHGADAIAVEVVNSGDVDAAGFYVVYYLGSEADPECGNANYVTYSWVTGLAAGDTMVTATGAGVLAYVGGYGTHTFGALADYLCVVDESDETNNTITETFEILDPLDGIVWNIYRQTGADAFALFDTVETTPYYMDGAVTGDMEYCYYVTQVLSDASESDTSNHACAIPFAPVELPVPQNVAGTSDGWSVTIDWDHPDLTDFDPGAQVTYIDEEKVDDPSSYRIYNQSAYPDRTRQGGDTVDDAEVIDALPYSNTGTTTGYTDDYDEVCPYTGSTSPDVVYSFTPASDMNIEVSLCGEGTYYDTKVYVYEGEAGTLAQTLDGAGACNDDFCENSHTSWLSYLPGVMLTGGTTYYIVVDGYGGDLGEYEIQILEETPPNPIYAYGVYRDSVMVGQTPGPDEMVDPMFSEFVTVEGDYDYYVTAWYDVFGESDPSDTVTVTVEEPGPNLYPPANLMADVMGNDVMLSWDAPPGGPGWLTFSNGDFGTSIGTGGDMDAIGAQQFLPGMLYDYNGMYVIDIEFIPAEATATYQPIIFAPPPGVLPDSSHIVSVGPLMSGAELYMGEYNVVPVEPHQIDWTLELWIGVHIVTAAGYPAGTDTGPMVPGGAKILWGGVWYDLTDLNAALDYNWALGGFVDYNPPPIQLMANPGFENTYQGAEAWQLYATDWIWYPEGAGNHHIEADGNGIYNSDAVLETWDGMYSLKMWGGYTDAENHTSYYQGYAVDEDLAPGTEIIVDGFMMSHQDDWIGQGTNTVTLFVSYFDADWGFIGRDDSEPFSAADEASEWHHRYVDAVVPEGAVNVNIGVEYNQMNSDQHGSVYVDNVTAHVAPSAEQLLAGYDDLAGQDISFRFPSGDGAAFDHDPEFKHNGIVFPPTHADGSRDVLMHYNVWDYESLIAEVPFNEAWIDLYDEEWGEHEYTVTAVYEEGVSEPSNMVFVNLFNNPPSNFQLVAPADGTVITIDSTNLASGQIAAIWTPSGDADNDPILYTNTSAFEYLGQPAVWDSTTDQTSMFLPYAWFAAFMTEPGYEVDELTVSWTVYASDGVDTTWAGGGPRTLIVNVQALYMGVDGNNLPDEFALYENYPNPFNPVTNINYDISEATDVTLEVYNLMGHRVRTLVSRHHEPGRYKAVWDATNDFGASVASGMYIYRIHAKDFVSVKKLLLMK